MTTSGRGGSTAELVAELRAQADAAVVRAAETKEQVAREVGEVKQQAESVARALQASAQQSADQVLVEGGRRDEALVTEARANAAAMIADAEAKAAGIRVAAAELADDANAVLARAEVRHESAAIQADALRLTARREAALHRRQLLDETSDVAHRRIDAVSDVVARLGSTLDGLTRTLVDLAPASAKLHSELGAPEADAAEPGPDVPTETTGTSRSRI